jgi:hypothetical protein
MQVGRYFFEGMSRICTNYLQEGHKKRKDSNLKISILINFQCLYVIAKLT